MRVLVFGRTGQVARELDRACRAQGIDARFLGREQADLSQPLTCGKAIYDNDADIIINAAAYTAVDRAESDRETARLVNAAAPMAMARAARERGIPLLHVSTDYVFDGTADAPLTEEMRPNPLGVYGRTKMAGETGVMAMNGPHVILRTAWVFSTHGRNFVKTMLGLAESHDQLNVVADQIGGPTPAAAVAEALLTIAAAFHRGEGHTGIYHFTGAPPVSWADFAAAIFAGRSDAPRINRIPGAQYPTPAPRPAYSVLDCSRIARDYGIAQPDWREGLARVLEELEGRT